MSLVELNHNRLQWLESPEIRPYVFVRGENRIKNPGQKFDLDWFTQKPIYKNPLHVDSLDFADQILRMETKAFESSNMAMPRWVFYDCAIVPGFVAGFATKTESLSEPAKKLLEPGEESEWSPISLFIIIPTMGKGEWVAHNLSSINALVPEENKRYGLGFLTKAFALWYANVEVMVGMTQWTSPAVKLHTHYGDFEVLTAFTPVHSYSQTLTYRSKVDPAEWIRFFRKEPEPSFHRRYRDSGLRVDPLSDQSLKDFQSRIEKGEGPFFLSANEIRAQELGTELKIYTL